MIDALRAAGAMASAALAFLLMLAGTIKLADPRAATGSLRRVSSTLSRQPAGRLELAVRAIGCVELAAAIASTLLAGVPAVTGSAAVVVLCTGFLWFTHLARRRGAACGCWGSLSDGAAGSHEVLRRAVLLVVSIVALASTTHRAARVMPLTTAGALIVLGCGAGVVVLLAPRVGLARLASAAAIGVALPDGAQRAVSRRVRRATLHAVRGDRQVAALVAAMPQARIDWRRARVTSPNRRRQHLTNRLVAVPGAGGNLRVVAGPAGVLMAIGESPDAIYTSSGHGVTTARKPVGHPRGGGQGDVADASLGDVSVVGGAVGAGRATRC